MQAGLQERYSKLLQDALAGHFYVQEGYGYDKLQNPKSGVDLESDERYDLFMNDKEYSFKWRGLCSEDHSIPAGRPTACDVFYYLEMIDGMEKVKQGGLHYLAGMEEDGLEETFWYMLINFNTFQTVAPYKGPCHCELVLSEKWLKLRRSWDEKFARAKADPNDVQCMFASTKEGCQNKKGCLFKHNI